MINPIRAIALGCAALLSAAVVTTVATPDAHAQGSHGYYRGWHGHSRGYYHHRGWRGDYRRGGYYRGGGPVYVAPARPVYVAPARPVYVRPPHPGVTVHFGR